MQRLCVVALALVLFVSAICADDSNNNHGGPVPSCVDPRKDVEQALYAYQKSLDTLKRYGHAGIATLNANLAALNSHLSSRFISYSLNSSIVATYPRNDFLAFFSYIASVVYGGWSQHHVLNPTTVMTSFETATVACKLMELGKIGLVEEFTVSEFTASFVLEQGQWKILSMVETGHRTYDLVDDIQFARVWVANSGIIIPSVVRQAVAEAVLAKNFSDANARYNRDFDAIIAMASTYNATSPAYISALSKLINGTFCPDGVFTNWTSPPTPPAELSAYNQSQLANLYGTILARYVFYQASRHIISQPIVSIYTGPDGLSYGSFNASISQLVNEEGVVVMNIGHYQHTWLMQANGVPCMKQFISYTDAAFNFPANTTVGSIYPNPSSLLAN